MADDLNAMRRQLWHALCHAQEQLDNFGITAPSTVDALAADARALYASEVFPNICAACSPTLAPKP